MPTPKHVEDKGNGWVILSADFICAMVWPYGPPKQQPIKPKRRKKP